MPFPPAVTASVLAKILAVLAPLFLDAAGNDPEAARHAASDTLASYGPRNDREIRLAALIVAFSFAALDALSRAAEPGLSVSMVLRLRGNANALNRACELSERRLEALRRQTPGVTALPESAPDDLPDSLADLIALARPSATTAPAQPLSRQQRRLAERQAAEALRRQQKADRLAARAAARDASHVPSVSSPR
jgi:hypothetical protein